MRTKVASDDMLSKHMLSAQTNFTNSISPQRRAKVMNEARPLLTGHLKCREIWSALQLADYKKEGVLNDAALTVFYEKQAGNLQEMLTINSFDELQDLLDTDEDGFINEDEQIMLFSIIKERMQQLADELCAICEYNHYKEMMKSVRSLEDDILTYQEVLRKRTHKKEVTIYTELGENRYKHFTEEWHRKFDRFQEVCKRRVRELQDLHKKEMEDLNLELTSEFDYSRIRPLAKMRHLLVQEKLVAINERYSEAQQIRNEVKSLEFNEQNRVENQVLAKMDKLRNKLKQRQSKEINNLQIKNNTELNKLQIQFKQEESKVLKQIKRNSHEITRVQNLKTKRAERDGKLRDEIRRSKNKSRVMKRLLSDSKSTPARGKSLNATIILYSPEKSVMNAGALSTVSNLIGKIRNCSPLKFFTKDVTRFHITSHASAIDIPVNVRRASTGSPTLIGQAEKMLLQRKIKGIELPPLTSLYNSNLDPI